MKRILVAVDGSKHALAALKVALEDCRAAGPGVQLHILNVQPPLRGGAADFLGKKSIDDYHHEEGMKDLEAAIAAAREAGVEASHHIAVGDPGTTIARFADQVGADRIVVGSKGRGALADTVLGSAVRGLLEASRVPVLVVK